jgi:hypothetical protein
MSGAVSFRRILMFTAAAQAMAASQASAVDIEGVLPAALDQPRINAGIEVDGQILTVDVGSGEPVFANMEAFLDTGASGILISNGSADLLELVRAQHGGETVVFSDVGVAGGSQFNVSNPLTLHLAPYSPEIDSLAGEFDPTVYNQSFGPLRTQIGVPPVDDNVDPIQLILNTLDVFGMPVMRDKVVVMDPKPVNNALVLLDPDGELDVLDVTMRTHIANKPALGQSNPLIPQTDRTIKLSYGSFDAFTVTTPSGAAGPTLAHNPFIGPAPSPEAGADQSSSPVEIKFNGKSTSGSFLLDTGAAATLLSTHLAADLGITLDDTTDPDNPTLIGLPDGTETFTTTIAGIGGQQTVVGFYLDEMLLRTLEGTAGQTDVAPTEADIRFIGAPVYIADIILPHFEGDTNPLVLDGIFGMNYLVASTLFDSATLQFLDATTSPWDAIVFDEPAGLLGLQLVSAVPEPAGLGLLAMGAAGALLTRRQRRHDNA